MIIALETGNEAGFTSNYEQLLLELPSYHDLKEENSYHMMMLEMSAYLYNEYEIKSNRESGMGRSDITLKAKKDSLPSYVIEFKYTKDKTNDLKSLAKKAVNQIISQSYDVHLSNKIIYIGLAHYGKHVSVYRQEKKEHLI